MRVLLINPPYPVCETLTMPLGLLYVAACMEEAENEVFLEDLQLCRSPLATMKESLRSVKPQVVGITSFSLNLWIASKILRSVKRHNPAVLTVWGGPHVSFDDTQILRNHPWIDAVVRGEGEKTLVEVVDRFKQGEGLGGILGITWRGNDGSIHRNPLRPFREDLDAMPRPAWHLLPLAKYRAFGDGASVLTSRGCPHRCSFCLGRKMIGAKGRFRRPESVADEMEALVNLGFRRIRVEDDLFTYRKDRALAICREIHRRKLPIHWRAYARVDTVDPGLLEWMKKSGCERILFGAESGNAGILKRIRKGITPEQTRNAVEMARKAGIGVLASFVLGLPGETIQTLHETLDFARSLRVPYSLNLLTPYLGTEVRERAEEWGIEILSQDWRRYGQGTPVTATREVKPRDLEGAVGQFRRGLAEYLSDLLERERQGTLSSESREELDRNRRWSFLRRLISGEVLELWGKVTSREVKEGFHEVVHSIACRLEMRESQVREYLEPQIREGNIVLTTDRQGVRSWAWAAS